MTQETRMSSIRADSLSKVDVPADKLWSAQTGCVNHSYQEKFNEPTD